MGWGEPHEALAPPRGFGAVASKVLPKDKPFQCPECGMRFEHRIEGAEHCVEEAGRIGRVVILEDTRVDIP